MNHLLQPRFLGCLAVFSSAFFFYLSTVVIRWSQSRVAIDAAYFVFARFALGFAIVCAVFMLRRIRLQIYRPHLLMGRAATNCIAVFCFYKAVTTTSVAEANILNMTYPLFVGLFSWVFLKKQRDIKATATLFIAFVGVWLVLSPNALSVRSGNLWGLLSGISAAAAIIYLNLCRRHHDTDTILFFLFGMGTVLIACFFHQHLFIPGLLELCFLLLCGGLGVAGQYLLTLGFRFVTAVEGSVLSSSRILLAALLGPYLASDPPLGLYGWAGALMILVADIYLAARKLDQPAPPDLKT